ncbi:MAG: L-aspartate oxidase [Alphaproteobacteria bacterium]
MAEPHTHPQANEIDAGGALIVGAGLAGLFTALKLAPLPVTVLCRRPPGKAAASAWAQGGIAAAVCAGDTPGFHAADTIAAGAGIVDPEIARILAEDGPARIDDLVALGVPFDRDAQGRLACGREAAHSRPRIVHVSGDLAGAAIMTALARAASEAPSIRIMSGFDVTDLALAGGRVCGVWARDRGGDAHFIRANNVVLATGGIGGLYEVTTNPVAMRGAGLGMAARAGARVADPEFVQFHPTALDIGRDPAPLATEALRGAGAILVTERGERFMPAVHEDAELAPRDVVARAIHARLMAGHRVFLDCRKAIGAAFPERFPTVYAACRAAGIDPVRDRLPVAPAAHYHMGGVWTGDDGRTSVPGLWAVGEVAATGAHGANRLASNSLLEGLVFGARIARTLKASPAATVAGTPEPAVLSDTLPPAPLKRLRHTMTACAGLIRSEETLAKAASVLTNLERKGADAPACNALTVAKLVTAAAFARRESRGGHFRSDFPQADPARAHRTFLTLTEAEKAISEMTAQSLPGRRAVRP